MKKLLYLFFLMLIISCTQTTSNKYVPKSIEGYAPVYASSTDIENIAVTSPTPTINAGKIYAFGNYIFQNDIATGIHIIDNNNKANPIKIAFLKIPYNTEVAVKGNFLYANNLGDLLVFDISNTANPVLVKRVANVFPTVAQNYPMQSGVYFECVDASKGIVVNWIKKTLTNPKCQR
jgi:hypothetical protein